MSTTTRITLQEYLATTYHPDAEFVNGEVRLRSMGTLEHADWQGAILTWFRSHPEWNVKTYVEVRVRVSAENHRIPDVLVLDSMIPSKQIPDEGIVAVFEVVSPDDKFSELNEKLQDYANMGIPHIWVVDPKDGVFKRYIDGALLPVPIFNYENFAIFFKVDEIANLLLR
jgi:Uma2 family endonuclease